jgi:hypothetical protein
LSHRGSYFDGLYITKPTKNTKNTKKTTINAELAEPAEIRTRFDEVGLRSRPSCRPRT